VTDLLAQNRSLDSERRRLEAERRDADAQDGEPADAVAYDLRAWSVGPADRAVPTAPVPLSGRAPMTPAPLRELTFFQLCQRVGAPQAYVRGWNRECVLVLDRRRRCGGAAQDRSALR
jgi:hypothetical protein